MYVKYLSENDKEYKFGVISERGLKDESIVNYLNKSKFIMVKDIITLKDEFVRTDTIIIMILLDTYRDFVDLHVHMDNTFRCMDRRHLFNYIGNRYGSDHNIISTYNDELKVQLEKRIAALYEMLKKYGNETIYKDGFKMTKYLNELNVEQNAPLINKVEPIYRSHDSVFRGIWFTVEQDGKFISIYNIYNNATHVITMSEVAHYIEILCDRTKWPKDFDEYISNAIDSATIMNNFYLHDNFDIEMEAVSRCLKSILDHNDEG